jgi:predicted flap endonuclease-1-like 5' DNA nuclease
MTNQTISNIEGIGPVYAAKLKEAGIRSVSSLLKKCASKTGRKEVAHKTEIEESILLKWTNMADLYRVRGIGSEYAELLEKSGVDTVKELRTRVPLNLHEKISAINSDKKLVRVLPSLKKIESFVSEAKKLEPIITY